MFGAAAVLVLAAVESHASTRPDIALLRDRICALGTEQWVEPETTDAKLASDIAYDDHHATCSVQFIARGRWYSFEYRRKLHVSRKWHWSETTEELTVLVIDVDALDAQDGQLMPTQVMYDRDIDGVVDFGSRGTFGGAGTTEHFYRPSGSAESADRLCVAEACDPVGRQFVDLWQGRYDHSVEAALAYLDGLHR